MKSIHQTKIWTKLRGTFTSDCRFVQMAQSSRVGGIPLQDPIREPSWKHENLEMCKDWRKISEAIYTKRKDTIKKKLKKNKKSEENFTVSLLEVQFYLKGRKWNVEKTAEPEPKGTVSSKLAQAQSSQSSPHYSSQCYQKKNPFPFKFRNGETGQDAAAIERYSKDK